MEPIQSTAAEAASAGAEIGLLTGGGDRPYAVGLATALTEQGFAVDFIGSDQLDCPAVRQIPGVRFLNLRGDQSEQAALPRKMLRVVVFYARLLAYAVTARARIFHILWNNKFELFDRTLLLAFYRAAGRRLVMTAHNVNGARRDAKDSFVNRLSLKIQYHLCDRIFVHTEQMKRELVQDFGLASRKVVVIPFGINNTTPRTGLTSTEARQRLGLSPGAPVLLFFGQIAPYKGLHHLVSALSLLATRRRDIRLVIAGRVKQGHADYWTGIRQALSEAGLDASVSQRIGFIPDKDVEELFMAADVVVIPYTSIYQSGVPFLAYSHGLPVIATDVGSLREDVIDGQTGFVCRPEDPVDLANTIDGYFASELARDLDRRREAIRRFANQRYSWTTVGQITRAEYESLATHGKPRRDAVMPSKGIATR